MKEPRPLCPMPTTEVPLPRSPLAQVIAQVRFPPILAIHGPETVAGFQEALRETYPHLGRHQVHTIDLTAGPTPNVNQDVVWRLADRERDPRWQVSLGTGFVSLATPRYDSRRNFLDRLHAVVSAVEHTFKPADAQRLGLRYIDRLTGEAVERIDDLVRPGILGIMSPPRASSSPLTESIVHVMTEAQFVARNDGRVQGRWGLLPPNATHDPDLLEPIADPSWVLDLDMFTSVPQPFASEGLRATTRSFAECLYWLFREMVSEEFLSFYGGEPCSR